MFHELEASHDAPAASHDAPDMMQGSLRCRASGLCLRITGSEATLEQELRVTHELQSGVGSRSLSFNNIVKYLIII